MRKYPTGKFSYPEWPPSVIFFKAITPASISFLAQKTTPVQQPPKSLTPQTQAQSQRQPLPGLPGIRTPAQISSGFTTDDYLMLALAVILGCGLLYGIILAVKTPSRYVIGNWSTLIENFQASPKEFYVSVERAIESRQVPDIKKSRVDWKEGGLITALREYLRISREKLVLDICAAPYGTGFFVSWWLAELRPSAIGPTLVAIGIAVLLYDRLAYFGFATAVVYTPIGLILIALLLGILVNRSPGANWIRYVLVIPLIGKMIERFFMPPTYYRMDTEAMFKASIEQSVKEVLNQMLQAKGLRALTELELKPIMRDFFQK